MPSDLTLDKLKHTTPPATSTREQQISASHRKAQGLMSYDEFIKKEKDDINKQNLWLIKKMWDSEFRQNPTVATHKEVVTTFKNQVATALGTAGDLTDLVWSALQHGATRPGGVSDKPLPDISEKLDPFTSEAIAKRIGGDTEHWSWLPAQFTTPGVGPGEIRSIFGGVRGASAPKIKRLQEAMKDPSFAQSRYDVDKFKETGWFLTQDGTPRFHIDDSKAVFNWEDKLRNHPDFKDAKLGDDGTTEFKLHEILDHPELYDAYPELVNYPIKITWRNTRRGLEVRDDSKPGLWGQTVAGDHPVTGEHILGWVRLSNVKEGVPEHLRETLFHELQHVVQTIEGFARGGNADWEGFKQATRVMGDSDAKLKIFDFVDSGADSPDELAASLQAAGWPEMKIDYYLNNPEVNGYLGASMAYDTAEMNNYRRFHQDVLKDVSDSWAYVITNVDPNDAEKAVDMLIETMEQGDQVTLRHQLQRAYEHIYGEAEARLVGTVSRSTFNDIVGRLGRKGIDPGLEEKVRPGAPLTESPTPRTDPTKVRPITAEEKAFLETQVESSSVVDFEPRRLREEAKKVQGVIAELEAGIERNIPTNQLMVKAKQVLDDPELRPLMSQDKIDGLNKVINDWMTGQDASIDYTQELIEAQEDLLRDLLEKNPEIDNINIEDIIEGIQEL